MPLRQNTGENARGKLEVTEENEVDFIKKINLFNFFLLKKVESQGNNVTLEL